MAKETNVFRYRIEMDLMEHARDLVARKLEAEGEAALEAALAEVGFVRERTCRLKFATERMADTSRWCSECDADLSDVPIEYTNFCPNCGAKVVER